MMISISRGPVDSFLQRNLGSYAESLSARLDVSPAWLAVRAVVLGCATITAADIVHYIVQRRGIVMGIIFIPYWSVVCVLDLSRIRKLDDEHAKIIETGTLSIDYDKLSRKIISWRSFLFWMGVVFSAWLGIRNHDAYDLLWLLGAFCWVCGLHWATYFLPPPTKETTEALIPATALR